MIFPCPAVADDVRHERGGHAHPRLLLYSFQGARRAHGQGCRQERAGLLLCMHPAAPGVPVPVGVCKRWRWMCSTRGLWSTTKLLLAGACRRGHQQAVGAARVRRPHHPTRVGCGHGRQVWPGWGGAGGLLSMPGQLLSTLAAAQECAITRFARCTHSFSCSPCLLTGCPWACLAWVA